MDEKNAPMGFEPRNFCSLDMRFNQLSQYRDTDPPTQK